MSDSPNVSVVRSLYQARGNPEVIRQVLANDVRKLLTDFRTVPSMWALTVCFVIFLVASSQTLTNSSRTAPSSSSQANASSPLAAIRGVPEGPARGSPLVSPTCGHCKTG